MQFQSHTNENLYPPMLPPPVMHGLPQVFGLPNTQLPNSSVFSTAFSTFLPAEAKQRSLETEFFTDDNECWAKQPDPSFGGATVQSTRQADSPSGYGIQWNAVPAGSAIAQANVPVAEHLSRTPVEELIRDGWASRNGSHASVLPSRAGLQRQAGRMQVSQVDSGASVAATVDLTQDQTGGVSSSKGESCPPSVRGTPTPLHSSGHAKAPPSLPPQIQTHHVADIPQVSVPIPVQGQHALSPPAPTTHVVAVTQFLFHGTRRYVLDSDFPGKRQCVPGVLPATQQQQERRRALDGSFWEYMDFSKVCGPRAEFVWEQAALHFGRWFNHDDPDMALQVLLSCPPSTEDAFMKSSYAVEDSQLETMLASAFVKQFHVMKNITDIISSASHPSESHLALQVLSPKNNQQTLVLRLVAQKYKLGLEVVIDPSRGKMRWCLCRRALQGKSSC
jgi:hypothetical protein